MSFKDIWHTQKQGMEGLASVGVIGMHMVSGPLVGVGIGYFLDWWLGTGPWLKLVFLVIGVGAGFLNVYMDTKGLISKLDRDAAKHPHPVKESTSDENSDGDEPEDEQNPTQRRP